MMPYGDIDLGQHLTRKCPFWWWHQSVTWNSIDDLTSKVFSLDDIQHKTISHIFNLQYVFGDNIFKILDTSNRAQWVTHVKGMPIFGTWGVFHFENTFITRNKLGHNDAYPDSKVHGVNMGPTWVLSAPDGPHVGPMNLDIRVCWGKYKSPLVHIKADFTVHPDGPMCTLSDFLW